MAASSKDILKGIFYVFIGVFLAGLAIYVAKWAISNLPSALTNIGSTATQTQIASTSIIGSVLGVVLGIVPPITYEGLILFLAIFIIMLFAIADILQVFSSFSAATAWVISFGLAIIAGVTKVIAYVAGIFAITSGIGAVGVAILIIMAIVVAVLMNFFVGKAGIRNAMDAQKDQEKINEAGRKMRKGYGLLREGADIVDRP